MIYLAICKHCPDKEFYFGQTTNTFRKRMNGHRDKFNNEKFKNSALSYHVFNEHKDLKHLQLKNFNFGIIKKVSPLNLDRVEDSFIYRTKGDLISLNREIVVK